MSKTWLVADQHYGHEKILESCHRPFKNTREEESVMIKKNNSIVAPEDTVYHLGDVFWGDQWQRLAALLKRLNGNHHLILGNHDVRIPVWNFVEAGFISVHTSLMLDGYLLIHDPAVAGVFPELKVIHGHTHNLGLNLSKNTYCVSVELHDYTPVDFDVIKEYFKGVS